MNPSFHYDLVAVIQRINVPVPGTAVSRRRGALRLRVFVLKQCFPLVGTLGHEWVPERTPEGAKRSAAVEAKRRLVRAGSRGTIARRGGN